MAISTLQKTLTAEEALKKTALEIRETCRELDFPKNRILRFETEITPIDFLPWLSQNQNGTKIYFSNRDGRFEAAGLGIAYALHGTCVIDYDAVFYELKKYLTVENPRLKFFGGFAFNEKSIDSNWETFGRYRFVLPRFELSRRGNKIFFACNIFANALTEKVLNEILDELSALKISGFSQSPALPRAVSRRDEPLKDHWLKETQKILKILNRETFSKVVLARKSTFEFNQALNPIDFLKRLEELSPDCFHFCFQFDENSFLGASPERLYHRENKTIKTEAIAGTRPRGSSQLQDEKYTQELLGSQKERYEHELVVRTIEETLKKLCTKFSAEKENSLLILKSGQHLLSSFQGSLENDVSDAVILKLLHPTPAVCGCPTQTALKTILKLEPFKRGWYAAPVGYVGFNESEFAVGIRSGLISGHTLSLYAGAGLVSDSNPEAEWKEIETKIGNFIEVFKNGS